MGEETSRHKLAHKVGVGAEFKISHRLSELLGLSLPSHVLSHGTFAGEALRVRIARGGNADDAGKLQGQKQEQHGLLHDDLLLCDSFLDFVPFSCRGMRRS